RIAEDRFNIINDIRSNIDHVNDIKLDYFTKKDATLFIPYQQEQKETDKLLASLHVRDELYTVPTQSLTILRKEITLFYNFEKDMEYVRSNQTARYIHEQKAAILNQIDILSQDLLSQRADLLEKSRN